jgi:hypothetical protein
MKWKHTGNTVIQPLTTGTGHQKFLHEDIYNHTSPEEIIKWSLDKCITHSYKYDDMDR